MRWIVMNNHTGFRLIRLVADRVCYWSILWSAVIGFLMGVYMGANYLPDCRW